MNSAWRVIVPRCCWEALLLRADISPTVGSSIRSREPCELVMCWFQMSFCFFTWKFWDDEFFLMSKVSKVFKSVVQPPPVQTRRACKQAWTKHNFNLAKFKMGRLGLFLCQTTWVPRVPCGQRRLRSLLKLQRCAGDTPFAQMATPHKFDRKKKSRIFFCKFGLWKHGSNSDGYECSGVCMCRWVIFECVAKLGARKTFFFC